MHSMTQSNTHQFVFLTAENTKVLIDHIVPFRVLTRGGRILVLTDEQTLVKDGSVGAEEGELLTGWHTHVEDLTVVAHIGVVAVLTVHTAERFTNLGHNVLDSIGKAVRKIGPFLLKGLNQCFIRKQNYCQCEQNTRVLLRTSRREDGDLLDASSASAIKMAAKSTKVAKIFILEFCVCFTGFKDHN